MPKEEIALQLTLEMIEAGLIVRQTGESHNKQANINIADEVVAAYNTILEKLNLS